MTLTIPNPSNVKVQYNTRAEFEAASIPSVIDYVMAEGLAYQRDASGTALTAADGSTWSPAGHHSPQHFGAVGNGTTDDTTSLQAWIDWVEDSSVNLTGFLSSSPVFDLGGKLYAVTSTLTFSSIRTTVLKNGAFVAVSGGTGFDNGTYDLYSGDLPEGYVGWKDFVIDFGCAYGSIENVSVYCQDLANGVNLSAGRIHMTNSLVRRQVDCAIWGKDGSGGDKRLNNIVIQQINNTASGEDTTDQNNFTSIGVLMEQSDCKIENSTLSWCLRNYVATGGIQHIMNCHLFGGTEGTPRTNSTLIEWNPPSDGAGAITVENTYLDNGYVDLYNDRAKFFGCDLLLDSADVTQTSMFRVYAHDATHDGAIPRVIIDDCRLFEFTGASKIVEFIDEDFTWDPDADSVLAKLNDIASGGDRLVKQPNLSREIVSAVMSTTDWVHRYQSPQDRAMIQFEDAAQSGTHVSIGSSGATLWARTPTGTDFRVGDLVSTPDFKVDPGGTISAPNLPTYADNTSALAGGLVAGDCYSTATGELRIVV